MVILYVSLIYLALALFFFGVWRVLDWIDLDDDPYEAKQILPKGTILKHKGLPVELMYDTEVYSNHARRVDFDDGVSSE